MTRIITLYILLLTTTFGIFDRSKGQFSKIQITNGVAVKKGNSYYEKPFIGGVNSPQFSKMDLNQDGKMDIIIYDRSDYKILPFIKSTKGNFQYAPEYEKQLPPGKYIYLTADINSDGKMDVFTLSDIGDLIIHINKSSDTLQKLQFSNLGPGFYRNQYDTNHFILYNPLSFGSSINDLPAIQDVDLDGDLDIVTYDDFNLIYMMYSDVRKEKGWSKDTFEFQNMDYCYGYFWEGFDGEIILNSCPANLNFPKKLKPRHAGGAACWFYDQDNDGDMDMYISNINSPRITYLENARAQNGNSYDTFVMVDSLIFEGKSFKDYSFPGGYLIDVDGDNFDDLVVAPNNFIESQETKQVHYYKNNGVKTDTKFNYVTNEFITDQMIDLGGKSSPLLWDIDADGDLDLLIGNNGDFANTYGLADQIALFVNKGTSKEPLFELINENYLNLKQYGLSDIRINNGDIDNDGDLDLLIGTRKGSLVLFENTAGNKKPILLQLKSLDYLTFEKQPRENSFAPAVIDYNKDSINDLLIGNYNGYLILFEGKSKIKAEFELVSRNPWGIKSNEWLLNVEEPYFATNGYSVPHVNDFDLDGNLDIAVGTNYGDIRIYNIHNHPITDSLIATEKAFYNQFQGDTAAVIMGSYTTVTSGDLNGDSIPEWIIGCLRGGVLFGKSDKTINNNIGVEKLAHNNIEFKVLPNPSQSNKGITVLQPQFISDWNVVVYTVTGKIMLQKELLRNEPGVFMDTKNLEPGLYLIYLQSKTGFQSGIQKLIIEN